MECDFDTKQQPLVSILMACYNSEQWIREAINSIIIQNYTNWELIICDDYSIDNSVITINNLINTHNISSKTTFLRHKVNRGYGYTLWHCMKNSSGNIIAILDSDDALFDEYVLNKVVKTHRKYPEVSLTYSDYMECDSNLNPKRIYSTRQLLDNETYLTCVGNTMKKRQKVRISHLRAFKRIYYMATEGFNKKQRQTVDKDLTLKLEEVGKLKHIPEVLYKYRMHNHNISRSIAKQSSNKQLKIAQDRTSVFERAKQRRLKQGNQSFIWLNRTKCKNLQTKWGNYDNFKDIKGEGKKEIIKVLKKTIKQFNYKPSIIDIGCGTGHFMWQIKYLVSRLIGFDFSLPMLAFTEEQFYKHTSIIKPEYIHGTCWKLPFTDNEFDISYQIDVCMHIGDSWKSILEMIRITKRFVIFTGPSFENTFSKTIDEKFPNGKRWKINIPLLFEKLEQLKQNNVIFKYDLKYRKPSPVYNHKILVIEKQLNVEQN